MDLGEPPVDGRDFGFRAGGHVAEGQRAGEDVRRGIELEPQDVGQSAFFGFVLRTRGC
jgi:hypothetical protein